jgi:hypothetical protein
MLIKELALWAGQNHPGLTFYRPQTFNRRYQRLRLQHHSGASTEWPVVHYVMLVRSPAPKVVHADSGEARFARPPNDSVIERPREEFWKDRYDVELQHRFDSVLQIQ